MNLIQVDCSYQWRMGIIVITFFILMIGGYGGGGDCSERVDRWQSLLHEDNNHYNKISSNM